MSADDSVERWPGAREITLSAWNPVGLDGWYQRKMDKLFQATFEGGEQHGIPIEGTQDTVPVGTLAWQAFTPGGYVSDHLHPVGEELIRIRDVVVREGDEFFFPLGSFFITIKGGEETEARPGDEGPIREILQSRGGVAIVIVDFCFEADGTAYIIIASTHNSDQTARIQGIHVPADTIHRTRAGSEGGDWISLKPGQRAPNTVFSR